MLPLKEAIYNTPGNHEQSRDAYREYVAQMASKADGTIFLNSDPRHAEIVISELIKSAVEKVELLVDDLDVPWLRSVDFVYTTTKFLTDYSHATISVFSRNDVSNKNDFIEAIQEKFKDRVHVRQIPESMAKASGNFSFVLADSKSFRFEKDKNSSGAIVQFGDPEVGKALSRIFNSIAKSVMAYG